MCHRPDAAACYNGSWGPALAVPVPGTPTVEGYGLTDIDCASSTSCLAVGVQAAAWDGATWHDVAAPPVTLHDLSCGSATMCLATGPSSVWRWNGTQWNATNWPVTGSAQAVSCASATACVVVGRLPNQLHAERWDGATFTDISPADPAPVALDVSCPTDSQCLAVGDGPQVGPNDAWTATLSGNTWTTVAPPASTGAALEQVDCGSVSLCAAILGWGPGPGRQRLTGTIMGLTWAGPHDWNPDDIEATSDVALACATSGSLCLVSDGGIVKGFGGGSTGWPSPTTPPFVSAFSVACWSGGCVALATEDGVPTVLRREGSGWKTDPFPLPTVRQATADDISCPTATFCMSVGSYRYGTVDRERVDTWDGSSWTTVDAPGYRSLQPLRVTCVSSTFCIVVESWFIPLDDIWSDSVTILSTWDGDGWSSRTTVNDDTGMIGVSCLSATSCVASNGVRVLAWNGANWSTVASGFGDRHRPIHDLSCASLVACVGVSSAYSIVPPPLPCRR